MMNFKLLKSDTRTKARQGLWQTGHGEIQTPFFMPVGTNATVKGLSGEDLVDMEAQIVLSNTYHLYLRPGCELIGKFGGLHPFMCWDKPILTDSGGYQIFSLAKFRKLTDEGVKFQSHIDGKKHFLSPENVVALQQILGTDCMMPLDECAPYPCHFKEAKKSVERTTQWAKRSRAYFFDQQEEVSKPHRQQLFGIIQGATFEDLRRQSAEEILQIGFDGYAIGGVSVGEPVSLMFETVDWIVPMLPNDQPRYLMGIGMPDQIVKAVGEGIDMFDTCIPTRYGRHGSAFTSQGRIILLNAQYSSDMRPVDENCLCNVCRKYSRSYLRHLFKAGEMLGLRLLSYHNVFFYLQLMRDIRMAIQANAYREFQKKFLAEYGSGLAQPV